MTDRRELPVGVFDSGVGGISVLREMVRLLPGEDFFFYGDSANAPYGTKTAEEVRSLTKKAAARLYGKGIKALVVACNTATSAAIGCLREIYTDIPVIGIEPAVKPAASLPGNPVVVVMATPGTVHSERFLNLLDRYASHAKVFPVGCPGLMEYVEQGILEGDALRAHLEMLLAPCLKNRIDAVVLGCTHYPFLRNAIREVIGEGPLIMDGSYGTAMQLKRRLFQEQLLRDREEGGNITFEMGLPGREAFCRWLLSVDQTTENA